MKKELAIHLFCFAVFFLLITLFKQSFTLFILLFWLGGLFGTFLPDIDHLIYVYFLQPHELTSQRTQNSLSKGDVGGAVNLLVSTSNERSNLIFHSAWFQIIFLVVTFFVISSSSSLLAKGVVLAFSLHLLVDQFVDLSKSGTLTPWFSQLTINPVREKAIFYCITLLLLVGLMGILS